MDIVEYFQQEPPEEGQEGSPRAGEVLHGDHAWTGECCGTYVGDGQAESSSTQQDQPPTSVDFDVIGAELGLDDQPLDDFEEESSDNAHPLLIFYDCETTGFSIYDDHITDIAAQVVDSPVPLETPTFSSLVKTSRRIPNAGIVYKITCACLHFLSMKLQRSRVSPPPC